MTTKVSIVLACYNKAPYIGATLDSIIKQTWENVEVIIINDGSTDETSTVIKQWEPHLKKRKYDTTVIEQKNAGVAAAIKAGMERASGDYVCFPDADDELLPGYVSEMAALLDKDAALDFVSCDMLHRKAIGISTDALIAKHQRGNKHIYQDEKRLEKYLLLKYELSICKYLFRKRLLDQLGLPANIELTPPISQEPQILIPLFFSDARGVMLHRPLYVYNTYARGLGAVHIGDPIGKVMGEYGKLKENVIGRLPACDEYKRHLKKVSQFGNMLHAVSLMSDIPDSFCDLCLGMTKMLYPHICIEEKLVKEKGLALFLRAIGDRFLEIEYKLPTGSSRLYAYGSLGQEAKRLLPLLQNTSLWPSAFWDKAASKDSVVLDIHRVTAVDASYIKQGDIVLCFPVDDAILKEAIDIAAEKNAVVYSNNDIVGMIAAFYHPLPGLSIV